MTNRILNSLLICIICLFSLAISVQICPKNPSTGIELTCAVHCCESLEGSNLSYFCCDFTKQEDYQHKTRSERFIAYSNGFQIDYTLLVLGLIISIILSILLSFFCCLLCNGCWLHRQRNPHMYENVNDSGFYPICCGFGIPLGTVVFSTHPPQYNNDGMYNSSTASYASNRNRVRFNEDGTPRGVLKNGQPQPEHFA